MSQPTDPGLEPTSATFTGKTVFERRHTIVSMEVCGSVNCEQSVPYWVLVVKNDQKTFEYGKAYAMGSELPPESMEIDQVTLRPGNRVTVDGLIEPVTQDYALIDEIRKINLAMDTSVNPSAEIEVPAYYGWKCHSAKERNGELVYTNVWSTHDGYHLRIIASIAPDPRRDDRVYHEVATIDGASATVTPRTVTYRGKAPHGEISAELTIQDQADLLDDLPARLTVTRIYNNGSGLRVPVQSVDQEVCSPNRLHPMAQ